MTKFARSVGVRLRRVLQATHPKRTSGEPKAKTAASINGYESDLAIAFPYHIGCGTNLWLAPKNGIVEDTPCFLVSPPDLNSKPLKDTLVITPYIPPVLNAGSTN